MTLQLLQISKRYITSGETVHAVENLTLEIPAGEFVALYGPSGSGKTTLLAMAAAMIRPDEGVVLFEGRHVSTLSARESARYRRDHTGVVFQSFHLTGGATALENAAMKLLAQGMTLDQATAAARPWLERVGLSDRLSHRPAQMSMGERQRVAIARALANEPRLLLADEPTGNLDSRRSRDILELLADIAAERAIPVLLATHDPQAAVVADRVLTLRDGRLSEGLDLELASPATP
ncbi:MAG TPA: ABC transporter ATP-binding protein [Solirubrobacteraceae bacterium]|nr:ABC transporter ATP-binding protein [Solirubrobacteraceae bacterium]